MAEMIVVLAGFLIGFFGGGLFGILLMRHKMLEEIEVLNIEIEKLRVQRGY
ncbi:MAG: hypothetical protein QMC83_09000 [Thermodesulfovibrionales bacterium]|nr:hypothetical protein [Thermodesulfovibrionales bacterium]